MGSYVGHCRGSEPLQHVNRWAVAREQYQRQRALRSWRVAAVVFFDANPMKKGWKSMGINVVTSLCATRLNTSNASELWGDAPNSSPRGGLLKLIVVVIDRSDHTGVSSKQLNAYGIDPGRANESEFVFQAIITREQLSAFLQSVIDSGPRPSCPRWVTATGVVTDVGVEEPTGDPPTTRPKLTELASYADALPGF